TENLYIGRTPKTIHYAFMHELGIKLVINMRIGLPPRRDPISPPVSSLWLPCIDSPLFPIPMSFLKMGAQEALKVMNNGGAVYTHCSKGRHRGVAMGACILVAQGYSAEEAMQLIKQQRPASDPRVWYIRRRIKQFAKEWASSTPG
ncbi:MAG TPA: dual specificity protein phosphatase, partial [Anaerolineales bacterium]|nr:dual specificity protein phosphatase [Anaerolineales bacterium]